MCEGLSVLCAEHKQRLIELHPEQIVSLQYTSVLLRKFLTHSPIEMMVYVRTSK